MDEVTSKTSKIPKVPCPCDSCLGLKFFTEQTVRSHMEKQATLEQAERESKRPRTEEPEGDDDEDHDDRLHKDTSMSSFLLSLRLLMLYNTFSGVTQQCVDEIIRLITDVLGNLVPTTKLPVDFRSINKMMNKCMTPLEKYTACPEECKLFKGSKHQCKKKKCRGKNSDKTYFYLPLIPRLTQLYANPEIAKSLQQHAEQLSATSDGIVNDIHESRAWRELYGQGGLFYGNPRGIALEYSADGFQPFHHTTTKPYSIEQQASAILNLPPELRNKPGFILLHGLIPGPKAPKDDTSHIYTQPLVDELKVLLTVGKPDVWDAYRKEKFTLKASILLHVHDFPGQQHAFHGSGCGGKQPCPKCLVEGTYSKEMGKMIFRSGREFLEENDPLRLDKSFPGEKTEEGVPNTRKFEDERTLAAVSGTLAVIVEETPARSKERRNAKQAHQSVMARGGRKRCSGFDTLGNKEASKIAMEGMHTVQGVGKNLHGILNGHKDGVKVRNHEDSIKPKRFPGCLPDERGRLPEAPFTLTRDEMATADSRIARVSVPPEKGFLPSAIFNVCYSMKSHTWHLVLTKGIYPYALRGLLGRTQRIALIMFCHIMAICTSKTVYEEFLPLITKHLHRCMVVMDHEFPETLKTILWHMLHHLPEFLTKYGPIKSYWMFSFERMIHHHVSRLHNKQHPEASIINSCQIDALCTLLGSLSAKEPADENCGQYKEQRGNCVWRGGEDKSHTGSKVYERDRNGEVYFGRIKNFFEVSTEGKTTRYANIHWYEKASEDVASKLLTYKAGTHAKDGAPYPAIPVNQLSQPLITAEEDGTVFVLDFMDHKRTQELLDWMDRGPAQQ